MNKHTDLRVHEHSGAILRRLSTRTILFIHKEKPPDLTLQQRMKLMKVHK
jgi:hypothetical protein